MKTVIIAEKPSVAREIASIVGATDKQNGYLSGNGYQVTWALGHLVSLAMPEHYGAVGFKKEHLPLIPETFLLTPKQVKSDQGYKDDQGALKQLKTIHELFKNCDKIIVATDAGREGELIFRYIYHYLKCTKPFDRLWISSLTEKSIRQGLDNLKKGSLYDNLYQAAQTRSQADWLVGINASQALSVAAGRGVYSLGRVQTPTLAMVCKRYLENKHFVSLPFWQVELHTQKSNLSFCALSKDKYERKEDADAVLKELQKNSSVLVQSVEQKQVNEEPPLLYDLTTLQKEANTKHGFSAEKTLSIAQKLYEAKLTTYPRTGSRYISADVFEQIPPLIDTLKEHPRFGSYSQKMNTKNLNIRCVDDQKVTDHHAIIITGESPKGLSGDDKTLYEMIAGRMLESFSEKCIKQITTITLKDCETLFETRGTTIRQEGWRSVWGQSQENKEEPAGNLPIVVEAEQLPVIQSVVIEKRTQAKPLYTEASLLGAMETAGKELENEEQRHAMKQVGLGTPATRASIIETLFHRDYMTREKKSLVPTDKGLAVYQVVKDKKIANAELTGMWEEAFAQIESGKLEASHFSTSIQVYARQITMELLTSTIEQPKGETQTCPKCKSAFINFYPKVVKCSDAGCNLTIFKTICEKEIPRQQIHRLLTTGKTDLIKGFKSKTGKIFDAQLEFTEGFTLHFVFSPKKKPGK